jgi:threonine/homoserine/homoserine lactone efflux protein
MAPFTLFITSLVVGFSGALMPGPLLTAVIAESCRSGARGGVYAVLGHGALEAALVFALVLGLGRYLVLDPVLGALGLLGGAALVWLGYTMARGAARVAAELAAPAGSGGRGVGAGSSGASSSAGGSVPARRHGPGPLLTGVVTSLSNPYWSLWWATVGAGYLAYAMSSGALGVGSFFFGHFSSDFIWYSAISLAVAGGRRFLRPGFYHGLLFACGIALVGLGGYFLWSGVARLV